MKKRDLKGFFKDVHKFNDSNMNFKQKKVMHGNAGKINLPYKMF
jgi:hypothetical protein